MTDYRSEIAMLGRMIDRGIIDLRIGIDRMEANLLMDQVQRRSL